MHIHKINYLLLSLALPALLLLQGCSDTSARLPNGTDNATARALPDWAPDNPSPELLRAAKILKPMPGTDESLEKVAARARHNQTLPHVWELFGSLSDKQIERFQSVKEVSLQVTDMSAQQRKLLDNFFSSWRSAMQGLAPSETNEYPQDALVELYKVGAKEDLSNVQVNFVIRPSGRVAAIIYVRQPDGTLKMGLPLGIGNI